MIDYLKAAVGGTPLEWGSLAATVVFLILLGRQKVAGWPIGILACVGYGWVFAGAKLYADATLQVIFACQLAYGWWVWSQRNEFGEALQIRRMTSRQWLQFLAVWLGAGLTYGEVLARFTDAHFPRADALLAAASVVVQFLQARKFLENWLLWIAINIGYGVLYWQKDLRPTAFLMLLLIGLALHGWLTWRRQAKGCVHESWGS